MMIWKKIFLGLLLGSSFTFALNYHSDGKVIYEPMDVTVTPLDNITVQPIKVVYYPLPDGDNDGINNDIDNCKYIANSNQKDYDNDGYGDVCDSDDDNDGILDTKEIELGLNPKSKDSDSDGILDNIEIGDINNPIDTDRDGVIDALDEDSDNDGVSDFDERIAGTDPRDATDYSGEKVMTDKEKALFIILRNRTYQFNRNREKNPRITIPTVLMIDSMKEE